VVSSASGGNYQIPAGGVPGLSSIVPSAEVNCDGMVLGQSPLRASVRSQITLGNVVCILLRSNQANFEQGVPNIVIRF
jgi:hypothetical protein